MGPGVAPAPLTLGQLEEAATRGITQADPLMDTLDTGTAKRLLALHWLFDAARADTRWRRWLWVPVLWCLERLLARAA